MADEHHERSLASELLVETRRLRSILTNAAGAYYGERAQSYAAAIAFYALFSLFPMVLIVVSLGTFVFGEETRQDDLVQALIDNVAFLDEGDREELHDSVSGTIRNREPIGVLGVLLGLYAGSAFFGSIRTALTAILGRGSADRPHFRQLVMFGARKLVDGALALLTILLIVGLVTLASATSFAQVGRGALFGWTVPGPFLPPLALGLALGRTIVIAFLCTVAFLSIARGTILRRSAAAGAIVAAVAIELLGLGFTEFAARIANFDATYGAIGFVIALLAYVYLAAQSLLFGAEVAKAHSTATLLALQKNP